MSQLFYDINKNLCETYKGLDPIKLLDYPAEDVFDLIAGTMDYNQRQNKASVHSKNNGVIRKPAGDNWF